MELYLGEAETLERSALCVFGYVFNSSCGPLNRVLLRYSKKAVDPALKSSAVHLGSLIIMYSFVRFNAIVTLKIYTYNT